MSSANAHDLLSGRIGVDEKIVTYRLLSRELKVHVNTAKQLLFEYYQSCKTSSKSIHATYVITGLRQPKADPVVKNEVDQNGDTEMDDAEPEFQTQTSLYEAGQLVKTICVVPEEKLEAVKEKFSKITGVHIYSLQPAPLKDLSLLTTPSYDLRHSTKYNTGQTSDELGQAYGSIISATAKRRTGVAPVPAPVSAKPSPALQKAAASAKSSPVPTPKPTAASQNKPETTPANMGTDAKPTPPTASTPATATAKRTASAKSTKAPTRTKSNIMASLKAMPPKPKPTPKEVKEEVIQASEYDDPEAMDVDEDVEEALHLEDKRKKQLADLSTMMEEPDAPAVEDADVETPTPAAEDAESMQEESQITMNADAPDSQTSVAPPVAGGSGTKRKRRAVKKKTTAMDEKGYLVTKEETVWESYDEEEPAPASKVPALKRTESKGPVAKKGGKKAAGTGQSTLMGWFGKK
ncbi:hypothetical protein SAICODRAFT_24725 [Saitoella complicata NRRL Y-17804]|uniref:uncharacterized protein n=1 Tax=Saitoella complicata (strain BCRC 22490 / CBS 7301 / JCM 7358 / NBRC 10748 / NRRL Y-17804) TaxID=698492 RepID=UPI0008671234|nr:uncharacterized protein SAICODRAFT_24725 [Saitoella complicata NRRL Y-17804]ODQ53955.1 hypothetical protein SAICODRAFT_24725 [Saitoella complicata NRRL Y-17804]